MWVSSIRVRGLASEGAEPNDTPAAPIERTFERADRLGGTDGPLVDAIRLLASGLDRSQAAATALALGWGAGPLDPDRSLDQVAIAHPWAVRSMLAPGPRPQVVVEAVLEVDPPLYGRLRDAVIRDPHLVEGLGEGRITVRVGWLFTQDLAFASVDRLGFALGDVAVSLSEPAPWVGPLLDELGRRFLVLDEEPIAEVAERLAGALLGPDPVGRVGASGALAALADPAFGHGPLELVRTPAGAGLALGASLRPLRWAGPDAAWHARLVEAVHVRRPDILVVPRGFSASIEAWLTDRTQGDDATLEQVLMAGAP